MRIFDAKKPKGTKLGNINPGTLVMVDTDDGSSRGPYIVVSASAPVGVYNAIHEGPPPPPAPPMPPPPPLPGTGWGHSNDNKTRLLDPASGLLYLAHSSSRAHELRGASVVLNHIEGA